ncbi:MAG: hypothetical protein K2J88_02945 [Oscillospiraceae bacterium]|nr:hypothetical protein [Oscillospiraceae bacterium]
MKKINILNLILLALVFCFLATACKKSNEIEIIETTITTNTTITTTSTIETTTTTNMTIATTSTAETTTTTNMTIATTPTTTTSTTTTTPITDNITTETTENAEKIADKQLVKEILMKYHDTYYMEHYNIHYTEEQAEESANYMVDNAELYSPVGSINSEEDAIEKAKAILIEYIGQDYINRIEKDFTIYEGQEIKIERDYPPYTVTYYKEFDAWLVFTHPLSGKIVKEDTSVVGVATPGTFPDVFLRGNDGKVLGIGSS